MCCNSSLNGLYCLLRYDMHSGLYVCTFPAAAAAAVFTFHCVDGWFSIACHCVTVGGWQLLWGTTHNTLWNVGNQPLSTT